MKSFEKDEDFNINPELFHTDLKFLDCEYFLSDHVNQEKYLKCLKPPIIKIRSASLDNEEGTN
jgi:hypothetical protein